MNPLIVRVRQFVRQHALAGPDARVVAAVAGGSDSVALAHILHELHRAGNLTLVGVAHLNHGLRDTAERDVQLAQRVAGSLGLPAFVECSDVRGRATRERRSIEDAAHAERYEFYERARQSQTADLVALGHTRDDQAETVLLRMIRGAGAQGLAGMYPRRGTVVRPLLGCRRGELREYLDARHIAYVDDESNTDVSIARNRVRAELLPLLETRFNPGIVDVLADQAALARETWEAVREAAAELYARVTSESERAGERRLNAAALAAALPALRRAVVRRAMSEVSGGRPISFAHTEAALRLLDSDVDGELDLPGHRMQRLGEWLVLTGRPAGSVGRAHADHAIVFHYRLPVPGEVRLSEAPCVVSAEPLVAETAGVATGAGMGNGPVAHVRLDLCREALGVRNRRPGDSFRPAGLGGRKKLQDFFVDRKVARALRDSVPLVVDQSDRIVWVGGYGIDEAFRVTDASQGVLILRLKQV